MDGSLSFPVATPPAPGETVAIASGVYWLRMRLPFALNHINLWLLEDGPGWTIVLRVAVSQRNRAGPGTRVIDLGGRLTIPAFGDAHVHPVHRWGGPVSQLRLVGCRGHPCPARQSSGQRCARL